MRISDIHTSVLRRFRKGVVIPAMPLALSPRREFDALHQRALIRYYIDAGVGGIAVGVHTTQFEIREPKYDLYKRLLEFCSGTVDRWCAGGRPEILKVAGICGKTRQAEGEAHLAAGTGYHAGLLSLGAFKGSGIEEMIDHCEKISRILPVVGFYLQPAAGGRILSYRFWKRFAEIDNVLALKIAPFNRYQTLDVIRGICDAGREEEITLYTGNDDSIVMDLLGEYCIGSVSGEKRVRIKGGLLGHWAVWTRRAVELLEEIQGILDSEAPIPPGLLARAVQITDANAAFFDAANDFRGCIPGIHSVLFRQGLFQGIACLDPGLKPSPGQPEEIDRVCAAYPHLNDDEFVRHNLDRWLGD